MAQNKLISVILVSLLVVLFQEIQCIAGRRLMLEQNPKFLKVQTDSRVILAKEAEGTDGKINWHGVNINIKAADASTTQSPPSLPSMEVAVEAAQAPSPKNVGDFRPTTPGHSPGVGHSIQN